MTEPTLWLVSPVYLDVESYIRLRKETLEQLEPVLAAFDRVRFVAVDDSGGTDTEIARLAALGDVRVVQVPFNLGHQRALVFGLRTIVPDVRPDDYVVTLDSDGEDRPDDLLRMLEPLRRDGASLHTIVVAHRTKRKESPSFKVLYLAFTLLFRVLTGVVVRSGNYAAFRGWFVANVLRHPSFDLCYSSSLLSLNLAIVYVPCERGTRYAGRSRMGPTKLIMHGIRMLMPFNDRIATRALIAFTAMFGATVAAAFAILGVRVFSDLAIPGWASTMLLLLITLSFVALGNFVVLFAIFSQSRGIALSEIEGRAGRSV